MYYLIIFLLININLVRIDIGNSDFIEIFKQSMNQENISFKSQYILEKKEGI